MGAEAGWYTYDSVVGWAPESASDKIIPFGSGVQIGSDCGAIVTFTGQVEGEKSFEINDESVGGFTWTGNATPVDLQLKDFAITPPDGGLWSELSIVLVAFNSRGQIEGTYVYLDDVQGANMGAEAGWYTYDSVVGWAPESAGDVNVASGEMFQVGSDCGATITVPSALLIAE